MVSWISAEPQLAGKSLRYFGEAEENDADCTSGCATGVEGSVAGAGTASASNSKDLQAVERETAKTPASSRSAGKKTGAALKPVKDKPNPPINFGGNGGAKGPGTVSQGSNPYKGRVKQKHSHQ